jgi:hypothetical protein
VTTGGATAQGGTLAPNGPAGVTYTPPADYVGADSFTYNVTDNDGATAAAVETVSITVDPVNDEPTVSGSLHTIAEDAPLTFPISPLYNDPVEGDPFDPATWTLGTLPTQGTAGFNSGTSQITYSPAPDVHGVDSFTWNIADSDGVDPRMALAEASVSHRSPSSRSTTPPSPMATASR